MSENHHLIVCPVCYKTQRSLPVHLRDCCLKGRPEDDIGSTTNGQRDLVYQFLADGWVVDAEDVHKFIANHPDYGMEEMVMEYLAKLGHHIPPVPVRPARLRKQRKATQAVDRDHAINHRLRALYRKPQQPDASPPEVTLDSLRPRVLAIMSAGSCAVVITGLTLKYCKMEYKQPVSENTKQLLFRYTVDNVLSLLFVFGIGKCMIAFI